MKTETKAKSVPTEAVPNCNLCGSTESSRTIATKGWQIRICAQCGLGRTDPRPASVSLPEYYGEDYWRIGTEGEGERYTPREVKHLLYRYGRRVQHLKRYKSRGRLLEIGTGFGFFLEAAQRKGFEVQGVEYSPWVAEQARKMFQLPVQVGSVDEFDPAGQKYDVIVMWHVLEHLTDPMETVRRIRSWLNDGGIFAVEVPNCASVDAMKLGGQWDGWWPPYHLWHFTAHSLSQMLEKAGFEVVGTKFGRSTYVRHRLKRYPVVGWFRCLVDCWFKGNWVRQVAVAKPQPRGASQSGR